MKRKSMKLKSGDVTKNLTLTISISKLLRPRIWLGMQLFKLGARIMGCNIEFKRADEQ